MSIILKNGKTIIDGKLKKSNVVCEGAYIKHVNDFDDCYVGEVIDCTNLYVFPGFIDCHIHGGGGGDSCTQTIESYTKIVQSQVKNGTTSIVLTIGGMSDAFVHESIDLIKKVNDLEVGANILGLHLEGPWINEEKRAAIPKEHLDEFGSIERAKALVCGYEKDIKIITLAPEIPNIGVIIEFLRKHNIAVSIGHTGASYDITMNAVASGANSFTHLFNASTPIVAREPGVIGAALVANECFCELIADGYHVHPANIRMVLNSKKDSIVLVTDAIEVTGTDATSFSLPGLDNIGVHDGRTWGPKDSLIGSILTQRQALKNMVAWKMDELITIVKMLTETPAKLLGIYPSKGCIKSGSIADFTIMDNNFNAVCTIVNGKVLYKK